MAKLIEMTQLSPTMEEGTMVKWLKNIGDSIAPGDIIAEVETDKAVMEMEAFDEGILLGIAAEDGAKVKVGLPIAVLGEKGEAIDDLLAEAKQKLQDGMAAATPAPAEEKQEPAPSPVAKEPAPKQETVAAPIQAAPPVVAPQTINREGGRLLVSPLARSIALKQGVDVRNVPGSGPEGRVLKRDILAYISEANASGMPKRKSAVKEETIAISGMRNVIAKRLTQSKINLPHFYLNLEFNAEKLIAIRQEMNQSFQNFAAKKEEKATKVSVNDFIIKAAALALAEVPAVNASWRGDHILQHGRIDIGVAVALEGGLITPYIRGADALTLPEINHSVKTLASKAKDKKLKPEEYTDGTFTISNLGMFGISNFTAIINEPEAAILAVGTLVEKPVVKQGAIVPGKTITVTMSCDHRVIDGAKGAEFLAVFREFVENPYLLFQ
ncbi:MAG: pyruvate dehydrogenase complex dihydrolipoamide acetyltransferase [Spirochaetota bacterium]